MIIIKRYICVIIGLLSVFTVLASCDSIRATDLNDWVGYYGWSDSVPGTTSGSTPLWEFIAISVYKENDHFYADYVANGYMMGSIAKAEVHGDKEKITLVLIEYAPDSYQRPFDIGDELFSLTKNGDELLTTWIADGPNFSGNYKGVEGIYFVRDDSIKEYFDQFL